MSKLQFILNLILISILLQYTFSSQQIPVNCTGQYNDQDNITQEPIFIKEVPNGKMFILPYDGKNITILNLTGSAYEMGFAYGSLQQYELSWIVENFISYMSSEIGNYFSFFNQIPTFLRNFISKYLMKTILKLVLDVNYMICKKYIPQRFNDEMQGMADSTGISIWDIRGIQMFPELIKAACSMIGVWGKASDTGYLYQLRALDFADSMPIGQYPAVVVYHSSEQNSIPFANIGWIGSLGTITGYSKEIGISQKQGDLSDKQTTRFGKPWTFALRDSLQFSRTLDNALDMLNNTKRTCSMYVGVGSKVDNTFRIIVEDAENFDVYDDKNWFFDDSVPQLDGILFKTLHGNYCFKNIIEANYGKINVETIKQICALDETGSAQLAIFDFQHNYIYLAYPIWEQSIPAYQRPVAFIDLNPFFA